MEPKIHYRIHKSPTFVPILSQTIPVYTTQYYLSKINFLIFHVQSLTSIFISLGPLSKESKYEALCDVS
jgi:hypothetical protein